MEKTFDEQDKKLKIISIELAEKIKQLREDIYDHINDLEIRNSLLRNRLDLHIRDGSRHNKENIEINEHDF